jgi:predicted homoserine dehydrogenase-like protein
MLSTLLAKRQAEGRPIRVGIIGTGKFGAGLVAQISQMQGMETSVIADINPDHARHAFASSGVPAEALVAAETTAEIEDAIRAGKPVIADDALAMIQAGPLDVVVEATGVPKVGARHAYEAIAHGKHVVMVNVETDTVGAILRRHADSAGVVYSLVDGDQPGVTMNIVDWCRTLGFEIVAAGRGTIYLDDDFEGTPDTVPERFGFSEEMLQRRTINLKMYNTFRDGTKAQVEMAALANAAGLVPDVRGMHEPSANLEDIPRLFSLREEGGLLSQHAHGFRTAHAHGGGNHGGQTRSGRRRDVGRGRRVHGQWDMRPRGRGAAGKPIAAGIGRGSGAAHRGGQGDRYLL